MIRKCGDVKNALSRATAAIAAVQRYIHADRYVALLGYKTFTSHYHIEHALDLLKQQSAAG